MVIGVMATEILTFNEIELANRLSALPRQKMIGFAAACAERLLPAYDRYSEKAALRTEDSMVYRRALETIWSHLLDREPDVKDLGKLANNCFISIPSEDDAWRQGEPYAEDAGAVVTFAVRAYSSDVPENAVHAARRVYEAVDNFVTSRNEANGISHIDEQKVLAHPLIQRELGRQRYDLEWLEAYRENSLDGEILRELRARSQRDALTVFTI